MNPQNDTLLTLLLLAPCLMAGVVAAVLLCPVRRPRSRRLTDREVRAMFRITSERSWQGQWN